METRKIVSYSEDSISDYQALIRDGWTDSGKVDGPFKFQDKRVMVRTATQAEAEQRKLNQMRIDNWNKLTPAQRRIRKEHHVLRSRGLDV